LKTVLVVIDMPCERLIASVRVLTRSEGGSGHPIYSPYKPQLHYRGTPEALCFDVAVIFEDSPISVGDRRVCEILLHRSELHHDYLRVGVHFELSDASELRAIGVVEKLI
jgi:translation elongation factor EF-Tu-like GTPase